MSRPHLRDVATAILDLDAGPLPAAVTDEATRSLLNIIGVAMGASRGEAVEVVVRAGLRHGGRGVAPVPGRSEPLDSTWLATGTGLAGHLDDFDDTHLATVIHPGAATFAAVLPTAVRTAPSGERLLRAFALGIEAQLRVGVAMSPTHYDEGWHITGTVGPIGAAVAAALLRGVGPDVLASAIGLAATRTIGHREGFGSTAKTFHPGKAAANGLVALAFAEDGVRAPQELLAGTGGYYGALSAHSEPASVVTELGERWEILANTYKPYPCGIVSHPALDAACDLAARVSPDRIEKVEVHSHPLVTELTGNPRPTTGLQARFSTIHGVTAGLIDGTLGLAQYTDERVLSPDVQALRERVRLVVDETCERDAVRVDVLLRDGSTVSSTVEHARGSAARPLTDAELDDKVTRLVEPVLPGRSPRLIGTVRDIAAAGDPTGLLAAMHPEGVA